MFQRKWILFAQIFPYYCRICANTNPHDFTYGFNYQCTSINKRLCKLKCSLHSIQKNKSKTFTPLGNELLPPSKNYTMKNYHIVYPMKQKDICDYDPICIMSNSLMFDDGCKSQCTSMNKNYLGCKVFFILDGRISWTHLHNLVMNSYLHQKIPPWKVTILCIQKK